MTTWDTICAIVFSSIDGGGSVLLYLLEQNIFLNCSSFYLKKILQFSFYLLKGDVKSKANALNLLTLLIQIRAGMGWMFVVFNQVHVFNSPQITIS
jgi:hypothetical protein